MMQRTFFLETDRLGFSHWEAEDIDLALQLWGNSETVRFVSAKGYFTDEEVQARLDLEIANRQNYGVQYYPLFSLESGDFVGCCGLRPIEDEDGLEFGFYFKTQYWRQGYAQEAAQAIFQYAEEVLKPKNIFAGHHPQNEASNIALGRLGFQYYKDVFYEPTGLVHPYYRLIK